MDTRFWGPSGWRLFHLMTFTYKPETDKESMREFLTTLPFVLPCKFCRSSLVSYYEELPFEPALDSSDSLSKWMYKIHNKVNNKLRKQGQNIPADPPFSSVKKVYLDRIQYGCTKTDFPGWEFLFSIIENHPFSKPSNSTPMKDAPSIQDIDPNNDSEMLKWNYISPERRFQYICRFWQSIPNVLPFEDWRTVWKRYSGGFCNKAWKSKQDSLKQLWKVRCAIEEELQLINKTKFKLLCNDLRLHRSGCAKSRNARTCRAKTMKNKTRRVKTNVRE